MRGFTLHETGISHGSLLAVPNALEGIPALFNIRQKAVLRIGRLDRCWNANCLPFSSKCLVMCFGRDLEPDYGHNQLLVLTY